MKRGSLVVVALIVAMIATLFAGCSNQQNEQNEAGNDDIEVLYSSKNYDYWSMDPATFEFS